MRIRAEINRAGEQVVHRIASNGSPLDEPAPKYIEIEEQEGAFYLFRYSDAGDCVADTWHATLEEAKRQAEFEFGIREGDWTLLGE